MAPVLCGMYPSAGGGTYLAHNTHRSCPQPGAMGRVKAVGLFMYQHVSAILPAEPWLPCLRDDAQPSRCPLRVE